MSATTAYRRKPMVVIIGTGGMGLATARRLAAGRSKSLFLGDMSEEKLDNAVETLASEGYMDIYSRTVDVSDFDSIRRFAKAVKIAASDDGLIETVVHTAGLSPSMASAKRILEVDLLGTVNVIEGFWPLLGRGSSLICVASVARFGAQGLLTGEMEEFLGLAGREDLGYILGESNNSGGSKTRSRITAEIIANLVGDDPATAYAVSKAANILRLHAAVRKFAERGARINSITPGVILTDMARKELEGPSGDMIRGMIEGMPMKRGGEADEIAGVVAFLAGKDASYITGTDIVVDGGFVAGNKGVLKTDVPGEVKG